MINKLGEEYKAFNSEGWRTVKVVAVLVLIFFALVWCTVKLMM